MYANDLFQATETDVMPVRSPVSLDSLFTVDSGDAKAADPSIAGTAKSLVGWKFLGEPFWRWFFFLVVLGAAMTVWRGALDHMR